LKRKLRVKLILANAKAIKTVSQGKGLNRVLIGCLIISEYENVNEQIYEKIFERLVRGRTPHSICVLEGGVLVQAQQTKPDQ